MNPILLCIQTPGKAKSIVICYLNIGNICSYRDIGHIPSLSGLVKDILHFLFLQLCFLHCLFLKFLPPETILGTSPKIFFYFIFHTHTGIRNTGYINKWT